MNTYNQNYNQQPQGQQAPANGPIKARLLNIKLHYVSVVDKVANRSDATKPMKYEATILIPKSNQEALQAVLSAWVQVAQQNNLPFNPQNPMQALGLSRFPIKDGDNTINADTGVATQPHPGHWYVRTSTQFRPSLATITGVQLADDKTQVVQNANEINQWFYNGVEAHASLTPFYYNNQGAGIGFNPAGLVSKGTGERLAAAVTVNVMEEFEGLFQDPGSFDFGAMEQQQAPATGGYDPNAYAAPNTGAPAGGYTPPATGGYDPNAYAPNTGQTNNQAPAGGYVPNTGGSTPTFTPPADTGAYTYTPPATPPATGGYDPNAQQNQQQQNNQTPAGTWTPGGGNYGTNQ